MWHTLQVGNSERVASVQDISYAKVFYYCTSILEWYLLPACMSTFFGFPFATSAWWLVYCSCWNPFKEIWRQDTHQRRNILGFTIDLVRIHPVAPVVVYSLFQQQCTFVYMTSSYGITNLFFIKSVVSLPWEIIYCSCNNSILNIITILMQ